MTLAFRNGITHLPAAEYVRCVLNGLNNDANATAKCLSLGEML